MPSLYHKIYERLRTDIRDGTLPIGAPLPSEAQLCQQFDVSRITVRRALAELAQEGLIERGAGRVARVVRPKLVQAIGTFEDPFNAIHLVRCTSIQLLSFDWRLAEGAIARALQLDDGDQVLHFERVREQDGAPIYHTDAFLPASIGSVVNRKALEQNSMHDVLAAAGIVPETVERQMGAVPCPKLLATLLGLKPAAPVFRVERLSRDAGGHPLHLTVGHWRWDRFSMRLNSRSSSHVGEIVFDAPQLIATHSEAPLKGKPSDN